MLRTPRRSGFTMLEVILVMAIVIILMAVALPSMDAWYGDTRVRGAADEIRSAFAEARARAIDTGTPYRFGVIRNKEKYRIAADSPENWSGSQGGSEEDSDDGQEKVGSLPKGIHFSPPDGATEEGGWVNVATFLPDGTCKNDARLEISEGHEGLTIIISVRGLTGIVTVKTKKQEEEDK